ncbi:MAG: DUF4419 domain-containing protein [Lysobacter sp.]|nr:DUF4419 domain-containing protein [Lysobacter sp.]
MHDTTFAVCADVDLGELQPTIDHASLLRTALRRPIEAMWTPSRPLIACEEDHALLSALRTAFYSHLPLRLSPDTIWLTLARGFALHVNLHAEALRHRFVRHEDKEKLVVERPDFFPGADNPWEEVFPEFAGQIASHTGGASSLLDADFSTSGPLERAVSQLMAMETFQAYFEYIMICGCGIPSITLTGTEEDWRNLRRKASRFADYGLETWIAALDPVLAEFERAKRGEVDTDFWRSMFRYRSGSGPAVMTGWANVLFPYMKDLHGKGFRENEHDGEDRLIPNPFLGDWRERFDTSERQHGGRRFEGPQGTGIGAFPACATSVPLKVFWGERETDMLLVGGLMGVSQRADDRALSVECGWIVAYANPVTP